MALNIISQLEREAEKRLQTLKGEFIQNSLCKKKTIRVLNIIREIV